MEVISERRLSVRVQVANQHKMENTSTMLVSRMFTTVDEKWLQIGIFKYKLLKNNLGLNKSKNSLSDLVS